MTAKQYKPIIQKVLKDGRKFASQDEFVNYLIAKMEEWEEMFSLAVESMGNVTQPPAQEKGYTPLIIAPSEAAPAVSSRREEDASARFGAQPAATDLFAEHFSKQEVFDYYQRELPKRIEVKPPKCDKPIVLEKRVTKSPGDDKMEMRRGGTYMTNVRITYALPEADRDHGECVTEYACTTDTSLDADAMMKKIVEQANSIYSSVQNKVPPRFAIPPPAALTVPGIEASREEILASNAFGAAQTDMLGPDGNGMDLEAIKAWGLPSAPEAAKNYGK
jgi:hypothetical protein